MDLNDKTSDTVHTHKDGIAEPDAKEEANEEEKIPFAMPSDTRTKDNMSVSSPCIESCVTSSIKEPRVMAGVRSKSTFPGGPSSSSLSIKRRKRLKSSNVDEKIIREISAMRKLLVDHMQLMEKSREEESEMRRTLYTEQMRALRNMNKRMEKEEELRLKKNIENKVEDKQ